MIEAFTKIAKPHGKFALRKGKKMKKLILSAALAAGILSIAAPSAVSAQGMQTTELPDGWLLRKSTASCSVASTETEKDGMTVFHSYKGATASGISILRSDQADVVDGVTYKLDVQIPDEPKAETDAIGMVLTGINGYLIMFPVELLIETDSVPAITFLRKDGKMSHTIHTKGAKYAIERLLDCSRNF